MNLTPFLLDPISSVTFYTFNEGGQLLGEYASANLPQAEYIYLDSTPIAVVKAGVAYYIETDHLGTPRQVVDRVRNVAVWKWDSLGNTFGASAPNEDPDGDTTKFDFNFRFPGQYYDGETGLNYNYFRDYEAGTGRYAESDPVGLNGGRNTYTYVGSDPFSWLDMYGRARGRYGNWVPSPSKPGRTKPFPGGIRPNLGNGIDWSILSPVNLQIVCIDAKCCPRNSPFSSPGGECTHSYGDFGGRQR